MEMHKNIEVLNTLITINNYRIEGYETASKETEEQDLQALFAQFIVTSEKCKHELVTEVTNLGGTPSESTKMTGKFFRVWMDVKAALTGKDRKSILNSCEYGEDAAKNTYEKALDENSADISAGQKSMLHTQLSLLRADHNTVKSMRDA